MHLEAISNERDVGRILTITYTWARRCVIAIIGGTVVLIGVLMIVFPGPAFVVIPAGLAILGLEFACARRWLQQLRTTGTKVLGRTRVWLWPGNAATPVDDEPATERESYRSRAVLARAPDVTRANTKRDCSRLP